MGKRSSPIDQQKWWQKLKEHRYIRHSLFVLLGFLLYAAMVSNVIPETLNISPGTMSDQDIRSPVTVEDRDETEQKKQEAAESVDSVYSIESRYAQNRVEKINEIFLLAKQVLDTQEERIQAYEAFEDNEDAGPSGAEGDLEDEEREIPPEPLTEEEKLENLRALMSSRTSQELSDQTLTALLNSDEEQLDQAEQIITNTIYDVMDDEIRMDELDVARDQAERRVSISIADQDLYEGMVELVRFGVTANYLYDQAATEEARQLAVETVEPVMIREGQLLVAQGQLVTSEVYHQLALAGLLDDHTNIYPYIGLAILVLIMTGLIGYFLSDAKTSLRTNNTHLLMYVLIFGLTLVVMKVVSFTHLIELPGISLIAPVAMGTMLMTILLHPRVALFSSMMFAVTASIIFNNETTSVVNFTHGIYVFFSCVAGTFFLSQSHRMARILQAGLFVAGLNILIVIAILMLRNAQFSLWEAGLSGAFAAGAGFLAAVLTIGLIPFFEAGFGILSTMKLIELSSPNHPLLRKILLEAPGTYHHSVIVANLAEAGCESVGANGLLARVGSYYHDLGKTRRPHFFIENQMKMDNPHDKISPQLSKTIITAHPYDGAAMLREHRMPKEIIDIAEQHHGTTLLKYFYFKAKQDDESSVTEEEFRYPGPRAQTRESAIVGIADSVEAAVRSMSKPTPEKIESLVNKIIADRLEDGQFNECDLTLKELNTVATSICETLQGTFHSRIEYPDEITEKNVDKEKVKKHG
ncbi:HD family phosphohydrolase [Alteribacter keqinensis]|uniref:HD family phosphohydrolase n=1 Tax=Alteribacter keqinensis TaxID=2483800 RepID=A0A3M7TTB2_9BACI|nr:HD family phosphohydrolase [Alteribacter keqinensis]RNA68868.1 HD family phosphohydrolase [Alteribacter keqinensis]